MNSDSKPTLTFYTNIPTPNQISFFKELSELFKLRVVYYSKIEKNREWAFELTEAFEIIVLKDNFIARLIQRWVVDYHFSWRIFSLAWRENSEYIIVGGSYSSTNATVALIFNKIKNKKIAYFSEPLFDVTNKFKYAIKWMYLRILNLCCDAIFCVSKKAIDSFNRNSVHVPKYLIPYNVDVNQFQKLNDQILSKFKDQYVSNNELIIMTMGELIHRKGIDILIKAVRSIPDTNIKFLVIGNGPDREHLIKLSANDSRIEFVGFQAPDQLPYFFAISDIFAFASRYDGWGVVIIEAIAANVPIISSNSVGAAVELFESSDLGILCESSNQQHFTTALISLIRDKKKRHDIKNASKKLIPSISSLYVANRVKSIFTMELMHSKK